MPHSRAEGAVGTAGDGAMEQLATLFHEGGQ